MTLGEINALVTRAETRKPKNPGSGSGLLIAQFAPDLFALIQREADERRRPSARMLESSATHIPEGQPWRSGG